MLVFRTHAWEFRHTKALHTVIILSAIVIAILVGAEVLYSQGVVSTTNRSVVWLLVVNVIAVLGLQIYSGNTGQMTISHVGFIAIGAYVSALFTINPMLKKSMLKGLPDWLYGVNLDLVWALSLAVIGAMLVAWMLGFVIVRLSYDGVIISTFALLLIIQSIIFAAKGWTNGATSIFGMPNLSSPWLLGAVAILSICLCTFFKESRIGLQVRAARDDRLAAESMGVHSKRLNHLSWVLGAGVAAAAGALMVHIVGAASPRNFYIVMTIELIAMMVLGGQKSVSGSFIGAVLVSLIIFIVRKFEGGVEIGSLQIPKIFGATQLVLSFAILFILYKKPGGIFGLNELTFAPWVNKGINPVLTKDINLQQKGELKTCGLTKRFGGLPALTDANLTVKPGQILGLIGPNGAGKSTLINTIMGTYFASDGALYLGGQDATLWPAYKLARGGIGRSFQQIKLAETLSVLENVMLPLAVMSGPDAALEGEALGWLQRLNILHHAHHLPSELPYGDQRRVEVARALALNPTYVLLDEPAAGMNPEETEELRQLLTNIRDELGIGIIIVEHDLPLIMTMCDQIVVLNRGKTIASGTPKEIQTNPAVIEAYIGSESDQHLLEPENLQRSKQQGGSV